ncbi:right-handed parallel beta-helix repeat-containing protein, partial [Anoxybacillus ayderensis]|uniref:right-handed parallel beta-helix repeat-containing protein n=1 Tax=Anoxybacillus ayderensis TaxID=265546 RepID=UPI0011781CB2
RLNEGTEVILRRCKIYGTKQHAILAQNGCTVTLEDCEIFKTENPGIFINKSHLYVRDSRIHSHGTNGVVIENGGKATFEHVHIHNNGYPNVWIGDIGSEATFIHSHIYDGKDGGVKVVKGGCVTFKQCEIYNNNSYGVQAIQKSIVVIGEQTQLFGGQGYGIRIEEDSKLDMKHGKIYDNNRGHVYVNRSTDVYIAFSEFHNGGEGIVFVDRSAGTIKDCKFDKQEKYSVKTTKDSELIIKNCTFARSNVGVWGAERAFIELQHSQFEDHQDKALFIEKYSKVKLSHTNFYNNLFGIDFAEHGEGTIDDCTFQHQHQSDVLIRWASDPHFQNCTFERSKGTGIIVYGNARGKIENCRIGYHEESGIKVTDGSELILKRCDIYENKKYGIEIEEYSEVYIQSVHMTNNGRENIRCATDSEMIEENSENIKSDTDFSKDLFKQFFGHEPLSKTTESSREFTDETITDPNLLEILSELNGLVGMNNIKRHIRETMIQTEVMRERAAFTGKNNQVVAGHIVLTGNPGTGKTTVAKLFGKLYKAMGLLSNGHVVQTNRSELVGQYIGHTAPRTQKQIDKAMGGVLFIDEAYELYKEATPNDFGKEAIAILLENMENRKGEFVVVVAGYEKEMNDFLESNPGLKSRFTHHFHIEDYTPDEMIEIAKKMAKDHEGLVFQKEALALLKEEFIRLWRKRDRFFSNARTVRNYVEEISKAQMLRVSQMPKLLRTKEVMLTLTHEDVAKVLAKGNEKVFNVPINEQMLKEVMGQLQSMIGLEGVKKEIKKLIDLVRYYREMNRPLRDMSLHMMLVGNPGTGKTETARLIAKIYEALGVLERGDLVEIKRDDIVNSSGSPEGMMAKYVEKAIGGTLFIDEAYQLTQYGVHDPGHKAVEVLLKEMEDRRGQFIVIVAGYPQEMKKFLASNKGLSRRFDLKLEFVDYTPEELLQISEQIVKKRDYVLSEEAKEKLLKYYKYVYERRDEAFGNGGFARKTVIESIKNTDLRVLNMPKHLRTEQVAKTILPEDIDCSVSL